MRGKKRPTAERVRAIGIAVVDGPAAAAQRTGIPENTIRSWLDTPEFVELRERTKEQVAGEWWAIVQKGFRRVEQLLESTEDIQKAALATAIVTDKMLLVSGDATVRTESKDISEPDAITRRRLRERFANLGSVPRSDPGDGVESPSSQGTATSA